MKLLGPVCLSVLLLSTLARPAETPEELSFTTKDGREFAKVTVTKVAAHNLEVLTATGPQTIRVVDLPDDLQQRLVSEGRAEAPPKVGDSLTFTTPDGKTFTNAVLRRIEPNGVTFETTNGFEKLPHARLPKDLAVHFEFNDERFNRYEAEERARQKTLAERQAAEAAAAVKTAQAKAPPLATPPPRTAPRVEEPRLGERGTKSLGAPRLGGRGLEK
jgi:hypothetical protein